MSSDNDDSKQEDSNQQSVLQIETRTSANENQNQSVLEKPCHATFINLKKDIYACKTQCDNINTMIESIASEISKLTKSPPESGKMVENLKKQLAEKDAEFQILNDEFQKALEVIEVNECNVDLEAELSQKNDQIKELVKQNFRLRDELHEERKELSSELFQKFKAKFVADKNAEQQKMMETQKNNWFGHWNAGVQEDVKEAGIGNQMTGNLNIQDPNNPLEVEMQKLLDPVFRKQLIKNPELFPQQELLYQRLKEIQDLTEKNLNLKLDEYRKARKIELEKSGNSALQDLKDTKGCDFKLPDVFTQNPNLNRLSASQPEQKVKKTPTNVENPDLYPVVSLETLLRDMLEPEKTEIELQNPPIQNLDQQKDPEDQKIENPILSDSATLRNLFKAANEQRKAEMERIRFGELQNPDFRLTKLHNQEESNIPVEDFDAGFRQYFENLTAKYEKETKIQEAILEKLQKDSLDKLETIKKYMNWTHNLEAEKVANMEYGRTLELQLEEARNEGRRLKEEYEKLLEKQKKFESEKKSP